MSDSGFDASAGEGAAASGRSATPAGRGKRRVPAVWAGVAAVAVAGLLAACGDDGGGDDAATVGDFCAQMERMNLELDSRGWFESEDGADQDTIAAVGSVDPPAEISDEWGTVVELTERSAEIRSEGGEAEETGDSEAAAERIVSYVDVQCSVALGSS